MKPCRQATKNQAQAPKLRPAGQNQRIEGPTSSYCSLHVNVYQAEWRLEEAQLCKLHHRMREPGLHTDNTTDPPGYSYPS